VSRPDTPGGTAQDIAARAAHKSTVDVDLMATMVREIIVDMAQGACAETITQTVQVIDLGNGKKAALRVTITTDQDSYM
jgi:hypothetical protein